MKAGNAFEITSLFAWLWSGSYQSNNHTESEIDSINLVETITVSFISPRPLWPWNLTTVTKLVRKSKAKCKAKQTSLSLEFNLQSIADVQLLAASGKDVPKIHNEVTQCLKQTCTVKTWSIKIDCEKTYLQHHIVNAPMTTKQGPDYQNCQEGVWRLSSGIIWKVSYTESKKSMFKVSATGGQPDKPTTDCYIDLLFLCESKN